MNCILSSRIFSIRNFEVATAHSRGLLHVAVHHSCLKQSLQSDGGNATKVGGICMPSCISDGVLSKNIEPKLEDGVFGVKMFPLLDLLPSSDIELR